ncbi:hypothetical protein [Pseudonocardia sp. 73-21]|nr:hypothetical protein [Pseudonocardia sp. 73-21]
MDPDQLVVGIAALGRSGDHAPGVELVGDRGKVDVEVSSQRAGLPIP